MDILFCKAEGPGPLSLTTCLVARIWSFHHCYPARFWLGTEAPLQAIVGWGHPRSTPLALANRTVASMVWVEAWWALVDWGTSPWNIPSWNPATSPWGSPRNHKKENQDLSQQSPADLQPGNNTNHSSQRETFQVWPFQNHLVNLQNHEE